MLKKKPSDNENLIRSLREAALGIYADDEHTLCIKAADRIEALLNDIAVLGSDIEYWRRRVTELEGSISKKDDNRVTQYRNISSASGVG